MAHKNFAVVSIFLKRNAAFYQMNTNISRAVKALLNSDLITQVVQIILHLAEVCSRSSDTF